MSNYEKIKVDIIGLKRVARVLKAYFMLIMLTGVLCIVFNESGILQPSDCLSVGTIQYTVLMLMELITICFIPVALKMLSLKLVKRKILKGGICIYRSFALFRISMIGLPMLANVFFYYQYMSVAFAYMAIIGALCFVFIYPSEGRCLNENW